IADLLYHQSGLLGVSGLSRNMQDLLSSHEAPAAEAVDYFCYQAKLQLARLTGALGGLNRLVFTGGIGENSAEIRGRICAGLGYLGIEVESGANKAGQTVISKSGARVIVEARATDEEKMIARHVAAQLAFHPVSHRTGTEG
ncbi:MAG: acetate kinase, partial [Jannaschia helgolandensis]